MHARAGTLTITKIEERWKNVNKVFYINQIYIPKLVVGRKVRLQFTFLLILMEACIHTDGPHHCQCLRIERYQSNNNKKHDVVKTDWP